MRIGYPGTKFQVHFYELEIKLLYEKVYHAINKIPNERFLSDSSSALPKSWLKTFYEDYYNRYEIDINSTAVVVEAGDPEYEIFLTITLAFYDPFKIELFLNYHQKKYPIKEDFEGLIEFKVYEYIELLLQFENSDRRERVMKWLMDSKKNRPSEPTINTDITIKWDGEISILKKLSKRLSKAGFTHRQTDFEKVFMENKPTQWRKEPEYLCYLLFKLRSFQKEPLFRASKGKGYFKLASNLFYEDSGKLVKKNFIADTIYSITERNPQNYDQIRKEIDLMLTQVFAQP